MVNSCSRCAVIQSEDDGDTSTVLSSSATKMMNVRLDGC